MLKRLFCIIKIVRNEEIEMKKGKKVILADYRWNLFRSAFRFSDFKVEEEDKEILTGSVYGILEIVKILVEHDPDIKIIFCLDGKPIERIKLLPTYKQHRHEGEPKPEIVAARTFHDEPIKILSGVPNVSFVVHEEKEADDMMAILAFREKGRGNHPIIFTGDKDLLQLMQFGIDVASHIEDGKLQPWSANHITTHPDFGVAPEELLFFRALDGDKSDDIPAALGGNKEMKREFAIHWHNSGDRYLENFDQLVESFIPKIEEMFKGKKARENNLERLKLIREDALRNIKLMELDIYHPVEEAFRKYKEDRNKEALKETKVKFDMQNIEQVEYDIDSSAIVDILNRFDLSRHKAWLNYNNFI